MGLQHEWWNQTSTTAGNTTTSSLTMEELLRVKHLVDSPVTINDAFDRWCWEHPRAVVLCHPSHVAAFEHVKRLYPSMKHITIHASNYLDPQDVYLMDLPIPQDLQDTSRLVLWSGDASKESKAS